MELISVIVPVYNAEKFLFRCVDSICNQTYTDLEIILHSQKHRDTMVMPHKFIIAYVVSVRFCFGKNAGSAFVRFLCGIEFV